MYFGGVSASESNPLASQMSSAGIAYSVRGMVNSAEFQNICNKFGLTWTQI